MSSEDRLQSRARAISRNQTAGIKSTIDDSKQFNQRPSSHFESSQYKIKIKSEEESN